MTSSMSAGADLPPVQLLNEAGAGAFVLVCDHASNRLPPPFDACLGVSDTDKIAHIAWDPGALGVSLHLSRLLDAPLVHSTISRLVIDCNRAETAVDLIPARSELTAVPGNANLTPEERARRIALSHAPFHDAIDHLLDKRAARGADSVIVSVHTYTPTYKGVDRPWEIGLIYGRDTSLAVPALAALGRDPVLTVGANEPYSPADGVYYTLTRHGEDRGLKTLMIEIRNNEVASAEAEELWALRLAAVLTESLAATKADLNAAGGVHA